MSTRAAGLLLAAGAGRRFGGPKALATLDGEAFVQRAVRTLTDGGCDPVHVVLGARAAQVRELLPAGVHAVTAPDWSSGMGASLRAGLAAIAELDVAAVLVHLVDLPGVSARVVATLAALSEPSVLARASYHGVPGHPVLLGNQYWPEIAASLHGDQGARGWLAGRTDLRFVECAELGAGADVDTPDDLPADGTGSRP
ncbi:nicotine blue oxidoreductase [Tamaricihabitans halophyticus]|uniref:Nicotine blue oxidoreductase n=1 Tax=Tamaricihabitans halophyticus TaxID=1262583 RepID=A0A4R2R0H9_9PSEU|nr:nucleotidyltransferase family protein [Tamaricihabitans halophyticus]TCP55059.1 nicotine blue oxidoreductase [Tamaricihabitans halophyticus]